MQTDPLGPATLLDFTLEFIADRSCPDCGCYIGDFTTPCPNCARCPECNELKVIDPEGSGCMVCLRCDFAPLISRETERRDKARRDWEDGTL